MLMQHIALVPEADGVSASELSRVSAALQTQVLRDFAPLWNIHATVTAFPRLEEVPVGYWPIILSRGGLGRDAGIHRDEHGQPYAHIELVPEWSLSASRTVLEMLSNPFGERTVTAPSPRTDQGFVQYLVEVCGPLLDSFHSYSIHDVSVSDFCTPAYYSVKSRDRELLSFQDAIRSPFQLLRGGQLMWNDPISNSWWMRSHFGDNPVDAQLGAWDDRYGCARDLARTHQPPRRPWRSLERDALGARRRVTHQQVLQASQNRAFRLRALLARHVEEETRLLFPPEADHVPHRAYGAPKTVRPTGFEEHDFEDFWGAAIADDGEASARVRSTRDPEPSTLEVLVDEVDVNGQEVDDDPSSLPNFDAEPSIFGNAMGGVLGKSPEHDGRTPLPVEAEDLASRPTRAANGALPPPLRAEREARAVAQDDAEREREGASVRRASLPLEVTSMPVRKANAAHDSFPPVSTSVFVDRGRGTTLVYGGTLLFAGLLIYAVSVGPLTPARTTEHAAKSAPAKVSQARVTAPVKNAANPTMPAQQVQAQAGSPTTTPAQPSDAPLSSPQASPQTSATPATQPASPKANAQPASAAQEIGATAGSTLAPANAVTSKSEAASEQSPASSRRRAREKRAQAVLGAPKISSASDKDLNKLLNTRD